jgi:iron complex transport system substrate-binding protein
VRDDEGTRLELAAEPRRIVSLMPAITETLFALDEGDKVVGGTESDDFPAAAKALPHVASYTGVQIEKVVALKPDLVIAGGDSGTQPADIARLRSLHLPVLVVYAGTVDAVLADIRLLGMVSGAYPEAVAMTGAMRTHIDAIAAAATAQPSHPRVFYELGDTPDLYGPSAHFFGVELIRLAGGEPITTGDPVSFTMPVERLVAADPEVIVLGDAAYGTTPEAVAKRPGWEGMTAVRTGAIRPVDDILVTRPGPRLADGLAALALAIDPKLQLP